MFRITIFLCFFFLSGCGSASTPSKAYTLTLRVGQQVEISEEALTVLLIKINDSRCPAMVQCIRAGEGKAILNVSQSGYDSATLED